MLRRVPVDILRAGFWLPGDLLEKSGRVLFKGGARLSKADLAKIRTRVIAGLYAGSDWPEDFGRNAPQQSQEAAGQAPTSGTSAASGGDSVAPASTGQGAINTNSLHAGMRLTQDIYNESGVMLLAAGTTVTPRFLDLLHQRRIQTLKLQDAPAERTEALFHNAYTRQLDGLLSKVLKQPEAFHAVPASQRPRLSLADFKAEADAGLEGHTAARGILEEVCNSLQSHDKSSPAELKGVVSEFTKLLTLDFDLLPLIVSMQRTPHDYIFDHCVNVAMISMAIGAQLGLDREQLMELGLGGLLQDVGMLLVPESIRLSSRPISPSERFEIERHPIHTIDLLEGVDGLVSTAKFIGYQAHERIDGSGYPRHRSSMFIHRFSKIVSIADAYSAMIRWRPYRGQMLPYEAAKTILTDGSKSKFDRQIVRAFLDCMSLFPIGSLVELSDGTRARVLRANPGAHTRPLIEVIDISNQLTGAIIDLSRENRLKIVGTPHPAVTGHTPKVIVT